MTGNSDVMLRLGEAALAERVERVVPLAGAGSRRRYYRIFGVDGRTVVGVEGTNAAENAAFLALARRMAACGLRVPHVLAVAPDGMTYVQQDLGDTSLYDLVAACRRSGLWDEQTLGLLRRVMADLPSLQFLTARDFDFSVCYPVPAFSAESVMWDLNYFKYCFLKVCHVDIDEPRLEADFRRLTAMLTECDDVPAFMYRDFQSRNVMVAPTDGASADQLLPYYIDFQGGRRGPFYYDVASFLWQARAGYPDDVRRDLLTVYRESLAAYVDVPTEVFDARLRLFVLFRMLQVLGAYGYLGLVEHKAMFFSSIPTALSSALATVATGAFDDMPTLVGVLREAASLSRFAAQPSDGRLTVRVTSFSYKRGIPDDDSGNGGGFVFDCRAPHNPGRYAEYRDLTGLDEPVIRFLEAQGEVQPFLAHVYGLVDPAVATYLRRGFTSLAVNFGCTGGQHRSVYCAQHLADHLRAIYPAASVIVSHRELHRS